MARNPWEHPRQRAVRHGRVKQKAQLAEQLLDEGLSERVMEKFGTAVFDKTYEPKVRWSLDTTKPGAPGSPILFISDWHRGEKVFREQVLGSNEYDTKLATKRLKHVITKATELLNVHLAAPKYPGIVLALGGDMISGSIHDELMAGDEEPPLVQAYGAAKDLSDGVAFLSEHFENVEVYGVPGNHGRVTRKSWAKFYAAQNLDWLCYQMVRDQCSRLKNVKFNVPPVRDMTFTVANRRIRLSHGDQFKGGDGLIGAIGPAMRGDAKKRVAASLMPGQPEAYDTLMIGHWHTFFYSPRLIVNGSIKGYDEFALQISAAWEPPQQALFTVHPKHGITWIMPVLADEGYTAHAIERKAA